MTVSDNVIRRNSFPEAARFMSLPSHCNSQIHCTSFAEISSPSRPAETSNHIQNQERQRWISGLALTPFAVVRTLPDTSSRRTLSFRGGVLKIISRPTAGWHAAVIFTCETAHQAVLSHLVLRNPRLQHPTISVAARHIPTAGSRAHRQSEPVSLIHAVSLERSVSTSQ